MLDNQIYRLVGYDTYYRALYYGTEYITKESTIFDKETELYVNKFSVIDKLNKRKKYDVIIKNVNSNIHSFICTCNGYTVKEGCVHVAAVLLNNKKLLKEQEYINELKESKKILNFYKSSKNNNIKEKINVELNIIEKNKQLEAKLKIGLKRLYTVSMTNKWNDFTNAYINNKNCELGKEFTYDSNLYYINEEGKKLIQYFIDKYIYEQKDNESIFNISSGEFEYLLSNYKKLIKINDKKINNIIYDNPIKYKLSLDNDIYTLNYDLNNIEFLQYKYLIKDNNLYIISNKDLNFIDRLLSLKLNRLQFEKKDAKLFTNGILKNIKKNIEIDENITDIQITPTPTPMLYIDLEDAIICNLKFKYNDTEINYFDESNILRDSEYEYDILKDIISYGFYINNNKLIIDEEDAMCYFIDNSLPDLAKKYEIFTNKKLDSAKVIKKIKSNNNFSIGENNILTYSFNINNIPNNELTNIFNALKNNKKYYKLKNNNIVKLDDEELNNMYDLINDLDLTNNDIKNGNIKMPKYKALYIDSIKNNNITTNNTFKEFINNFKKYKNTEIIFDEFDNNTLRDYQKDGVKWLTTLYNCDFGGILADEMGLGKSIQTISFIKQILKNNNDAKILIVVPTSLVYNWKKEFDKFGSNLKYTTIADVKDKRIKILDNVDDYNIFITSYGLVRNDIDLYSKINFELCILDEAQAIKNLTSGITKDVKEINAKCKIALTGTPVENNITELWSIFDFIMPGYLSNITKFKSKYKVKDINDESINTLSNLSHQIAPFILRRKKIDVLSSLPDKIVDNVYIELGDNQKNVYINELNNTKKEIENVLSTDGFNKSRIKILTLLTKLRQICIDPKVIYENYNYESAKIDELIKIVNESIINNHKILIFSSFKRILDNVSKIFDKNNITYYMIDGTVKSKDRLDLVDKFNNDNTNCFLITLKSGGTGLNLTGADIVIHLDIWWNPQVENQATDRAHRIGQTKTVNVIKLVTKGTIEEKIIELQDKKKFLADSLIEGNEEETLSKLTEKDIVNLLTYNNE